jgi:hypothetical protein
MTYIDEGSIFWVQKFLDLDTEACGILENTSDDKLRIILDAMGEEENGRKLCRFLRYSTYIWHTHPKSSKGYPSAEDIAKTLKHKQIYSQLIFTDWGIWEMYAGKKKVPSVNTVAAINNEANALYHLSEKGKILTSSNMFALESYIFALENNLSSYDFKIVFTSWWKLKGVKSYSLKIK